MAWHTMTVSIGATDFQAPLLVISCPVKLRAMTL